MKTSTPARLEITRWCCLAALLGAFSVVGATLILWLWMVMFALQWAVPHIAPAAS